MPGEGFVVHGTTASEEIDLRGPARDHIPEFYSRPNTNGSHRAITQTLAGRQMRSPARRTVKQYREIVTMVGLWHSPSQSTTTAPQESIPRRRSTQNVTTQHFVDEVFGSTKRCLP